MSGNAAVKAGKLLHVSPSQLTLHGRCKRRWFFQKVMKLPEPSGDAAAFGSEIHRGSEQFFHEGTEPDTTSVIGRYVKKVLQHYPAPSSTVESETSITGYVTAAGVPFAGFIDLIDHTDGDAIHLWDLKTRGSFERNHDPDSLARDSQMLVYARYSHKRFGRGPVKLTHLYVKTEPKRHGEEDFEPKAVCVSTVVQPEDVDEVFENVLTPAVEAVKLSAAAPSADDVEANTSDCYSFGKPCSYISRCSAQATSSTRLSSSFPSSTQSSTEVPMSLAAKLQSGTKAPTTQAPSSTAEGLTLYVDCIPTRGEEAFTRLEDIMAPIASDIAAKAGVTDIREIDFGKGKIALISALKRSPPTGVVLATSYGLSGEVVEALLPMAVKVVRSLR